MFDGSSLRDLVWEGRWDGVVMLAQGIWSNVLTHWWFGPLLAVLILTASSKALLRMAKFVGLAYIRGSHD